MTNNTSILDPSQVSPDFSMLPQLVLAEGPELPLSVRTSERGVYKRCRRKWWLSSENQLNREPITEAVHFWLGTGFHYAMEQHYGHKQISAVEAVELYYKHTKNNFSAEAQERLLQNYELLGGMVQNFIQWHDQMLGHFTTMKDRSGNPMVEVNLRVPLDMNINGRNVYYSATIDRIVQDPSGGIWLVDYKTAGKFNTEKLVNDSQVTAYYTMFEKMYGIRVAGMIYIQVLKALPDKPELLKNGKSLSKSKSMNTTPALYRAAIAEHGFNEEDYAEYLAYLESQEGGFETKYARVDFVERSEAQTASEYKHILAEVEEMVGAKGAVSLYPNPTRDCMWDCQFSTICIGMDDGSDWRRMLADTTRERGVREGSWREAIKKELAQKGVIQ